MTERRRALVTGITGQDGSFLTEHLLGLDYEVHGLIRRSSSFNTGRIMHVFQDPHEEDVQLHLHYGDLTGGSELGRLIRRIRPQEVYNLAAQSHVRVSFDTSEYTADVVGLGTVRLLEAIREADVDCRFYQASSSEMFGSSPPPQSESTPFHPRSPYATAKVFGFWTTVNYREAFGIHASNGILFNHESPRRGETFVTRKIARAIPRLITGEQEHLFLGNLEARRDWGHAEDFVRAMHLMVQHPVADDYVIGTGEDHSVREFVQLAFTRVDLDWEKYVRVDSRYFRPTEVDVLRADASKAKRELGWEPLVTFKDIVAEMVDAELVEAGLA